MAGASRARIFTCPRCKHQYWGAPGEQLPDCPQCGFDYRGREEFRFDLVFLMVLIVAMIGFMLLTSSYRGGSGTIGSRSFQESQPEKLPGR